MTISLDDAKALLAERDRQASENVAMRAEVARILAARPSRSLRDDAGRPVGRPSHLPEAGHRLLPPRDPGVYLFRCGDFVKIGRAANIFERFCAIQSANPHRLEYRGRLSLYPDEERAWHRVFRASRHRGEWFDWAPVAAHLGVDR